jgi:hypothetical protein
MLSTTTRGPEVECLPFVGRTWYRRGPAYWLRRACLSLFTLMLLAAYLSVVFGISLGINNKVGKIIFLTILLISCGLTVVWIKRRTRLRETDSNKWLLKELREWRLTFYILQWWKLAGLVLMLILLMGFTLNVLGLQQGQVLLRIGGLVLTLLASIAVLFGVIASGGFFLLLFISSFVPLPAREREARNRLSR